MSKQDTKRIPSSTRSALADAVAGVVGSFLALLVFYPIDLMKTNLQASHQQRQGKCNQDDDLDSNQDGRIESKGIKHVWAFSCRGLHYKAAHTVVSSFAYYFIYSWIFQKWHKIQKHKRETPSTATRLLLSAIAAMTNVVLTLPLDVLAARSQTQFHDQRTADTVNHVSLAQKEQMDQVWNEIETSISSNPQSFHNKNNNKNRDLLKSLSTTFLSKDVPLDRHTIMHLWSGLKPALLLCTNPSIHFTVFDTVKDMLLKYKSNHLQQNVNIIQKNHRHHLTMMEAFVIGLLAKFVATMLTYPLIRVKVLLMVAQKSHRILQDDTCSRDVSHDEHVKSDNKDSNSCPQKKDSMMNILMDIFEKEGMIGLYKGCTLQLLHTLLKSALSMMIRERVSEVTHRLIH